MTETEHLIRQAAREIGITLNIARDSKFTVEESADDHGTYKVQFVNRKGEETTVSVAMAWDYKAIHAALKNGWRGVTKDGA